MERSGSQKVLRIVSIISIIGGAFTFFGGIMALVGGGLLGSASPSEISSLTADTGMAQSELTSLAVGLGIVALVTATLYIIEGVLGLRAAKDATKIGPMRMLVIVSLVLAVAGAALDLLFGNIGTQVMINDVAEMAWSGFMFWICNNIKKQASL